MATPRTEFKAALSQVAAERGIEATVIFETLKRAMLAAYRKDYGGSEGLAVEIDEESGEVKILQDNKDITPAGFGRIAAQTAKQVILQGVREAEKVAILEEYSKKIGSVVSAMLQRKEGPHWIVDLGRTTALLPPEEQVARESYRQNQRLKVYLKEIAEIKGREQIIVSRADKELVKGLFAMEVPEVSAGSVEIKGIAREPGNRSKVAVVATQERVDPIGSCVGQRGVRVQAVTSELNNEKIDLVLWSEQPEKFIAAALSPAKISNIKVNLIRRIAKVEAPEDQLSLAIGREGQNVRLAAHLTNFKIDIAGAQVKKEKKKVAKAETELEGLGLSIRTVNTLRAAGLTLLKDLKKADTKELKAIKGIGPKALEEIKKCLS